MSTPYILIALGCLALLVIYLLIALVEGVALTLLRWSPFRASMTASVIINLLSGLVNGLLLIPLQRIPLIWLPISFFLSLLLETFILTYFKRHAALQNLSFTILVNLASYILLILPAYYFGTRP
jgi:hypothetical protein